MPPGDAEVVIRREACSAPDVDGEPHTARALIEAGEVKVTVAGVARYCATGGTLIRVDPEPDARREDVLLYLTGALMGAILHQRGAFPLHAGCVALDGAGVAFAGRSGAGKSTLVAAMVRHGAVFVSDDISVVFRTGDGSLAAWPGAARIKLHESNLCAVAVTTLESAGGNLGKYHLPVDRPADSTAPAPLDRVYLLMDGDGPPRIERLTGLDAVTALVDETYFLGWAAALGLQSQVFRLAGDVARTLEVNRLVRPRGLEYLPAIVDLIERRLD